MCKDAIVIGASFLVAMLRYYGRGASASAAAHAARYEYYVLASRSCAYCLLLAAADFALFQGSRQRLILLSPSSRLRQRFAPFANKIQVLLSVLNAMSSALLTPNLIKPINGVAASPPYAADSNCWLSFLVHTRTGKENSDKLF